MSDISLLGKTRFPVTNDIIVHIPTLAELRGNKDTEDRISEYWTMVNLFSATSCDIMIELDERGIDFTKWSDYNTFLMLYSSCKKELLQQNSELIFEGLDFSAFDVVADEHGRIVLKSTVNDAVIDEMVYMRLSTIFCTINGLKKNHRKMGNKIMKDYAIERAKAHRRNAKKMKQQATSGFDKQVIALVNNCNFKYDFDTINKLTIYDFTVCLKQLIKNRSVDNLYRGIYAGTIKYSAEYNKQLNWLDYES